MCQKQTSRNFNQHHHKGVSFPENETKPTIVVTFDKPAEVQSVILPRDKTPNANVEQFEVTFYSPDGNKINDKPIPSTSSPKDDKTKPPTVDLPQIPSDKPVSRVEITIVNTTDGKPPKDVVLDIKACTEPITGTTVSGDTPGTTVTGHPHRSTVSGETPRTTVRGVTSGTTVSRATPGTTVSGAATGTTISGQTYGTTLSGTKAGTTTKRCEEMQAVDEPTSKKITVLPTDVPEADKPKFQPTSPQGVSFPENETKPTIVVTFDKPAEVQSVILPRDKTPNANVEQFEVTFYSPDGNKINDKPIPSTSSPKDDKTKPPTVDLPQIPSDKPVSRVEITIVNTTDGKSPKDVVLDIKACTEPTTETTLSGQTPGTTVSGATPGTTVSGQTPGTSVSGQTTGTTVSGGTPGTTVSGATSGTTVSGQTPGTTISGATPGTTISGGTTGTTVSGATLGTTTKRCEEMQAVDEPTSKKITVLPTDVPEEDKPKFQPTSPQGVSFPENETKPTIVFRFDQPAEVQSVILPRDKTPNANVEQFEVTFYSPDGNKINDKPIPSTSSPKDDKTKPPTVDLPQIPSDKPVSRVEITIVNTTDGKSPKDVVLDIKACTEPTTATTVSGQTRGTTVRGATPAITISGHPHRSTVSGQTPETTVSGAEPGTTVSGATPGTTVSGQTSGTTVSGQTPGTTVSGATPATTVSGQTPGTTASGHTHRSTVSGATTGTTTKRCEEMQAVDELTSKKITVLPIDVPEGDKPKFQLTSPQGVSFPENETKPTIVVTFDKPAEVQSVILPRDKTPNQNVEYFEVTFYSPDGNKINDKPIPSTSSPKDDKTKPPTVDLPQIPSCKSVSRVEITIVNTTDGKSPKDVVLDIKACTEPTTATTVSGQTRGTTVSGATPGTTISGQTPGTTVSGATSGTTVSGQTPGTTVSGATPGTTVSGQTPGTTVSGGTPGTTVSGATSGTTVSGQTPGTTISGATPGTTISGGTTGRTVSGVTLGTTTKRCEEMQAVDEPTSKKITVLPTDVPQADKPKFQPTSPQGVSFPENETKPTIVFTFDKPAEVQSVILPRDKTPNANVEQFEVTFYSPDGNKINNKPIPSTLSPKDDKTKPPTVDLPQIPSDKPVSRVEITIVNTTDGKSPKDVVLDIKACTEPTTATTVSGQTRGTTVSGATPGTTISGQTPGTTVSGATSGTTVSGQTHGSTVSGATPSSTVSGATLGTTVSSGTPGTTISGQTYGTTVSGATTGTTTKRCEEMQAVDEPTSKKITVLPADVPEGDKPKFQPTSPQGVSFPENETKPTIVVTFDKPAEVQSVILPRDKTPNPNAEYFEVTFYSPDGNKINDKPIPSTSGPKDDKTKPPTVDLPQIPSDKPVSRVEITIVNTTDGKSPKDVVLDIKACTEPTTATTVSGQTTGTTGNGHPHRSTVSGATTGTTTKRCEEMQAVDEPTSKKITVLPTDVPEEDKPKFQPTSPQGVSFPENETKPTIVFTIR